MQWLPPGPPDGTLTVSNNGEARLKIIPQKSAGDETDEFHVDIATCEKEILKPSNLTAYPYTVSVPALIATVRLIVRRSCCSTRSVAVASVSRSCCEAAREEIQ